MLASVELSTLTISALVWHSHEFVDRGVYLEFAPNLICDLTHTLCVAGPGIVRRTDGEGAQHGNQTLVVLHIAKSPFSLDLPASSGLIAYKQSQPILTVLLFPPKLA